MKRRLFLSNSLALGSTSLVGLSAITSYAADPANPAELWVYFGTYPDPTQQRLNPDKVRAAAETARVAGRAATINIRLGAVALVVVAARAVVAGCIVVVVVVLRH